MDSAYDNMTQTPRASPRPMVSIHPAAIRSRRALFDTATSFNAGSSSATSVSMLAAQQNELSAQQGVLVATVERLARSVESLSHNSIDPAQILEHTDRLNMLSVNSPLNSFPQRPSPGIRTQSSTGQPREAPYQPPLQSRLQGTGRMGSFPAPSAYHHQQAPRRSNIPPQPSLPFVQTSQNRPNPLPQPNQPYSPYPLPRPPPNSVSYDPVTPWGEPEPLRHLVFTGKSVELKRFLVEIWDAI